MDLGRWVRRLIGRSGREEIDRTTFECVRCGERYGRPMTPCEKCGGSVMTELE